MAFLALFITIPLTLFAVLFAAVNTQDITVNIAFTGRDVAMPLYLLGLGLLGGGFFLGALFVWLHDQKVRVKCWRATRRADRLEKELETMQTSKSAPENTQAPQQRLMGKPV